MQKPPCFMHDLCSPFSLFPASKPQQINPSR
nr:MAG TPA: hypothetical protein [Caudoviricetes sp.]